MNPVSKDCSDGLACDPGLDCCAGECVDLRADRLHCGSCEVACEFPHACVAGRCSNSPCDSGFGGGLLSGEACRDDAAAGFSSTQNPSGSWTYGWAAARGGELNVLTATHHDPACGSDAWHVNPAGEPPNAHVYVNPSSEVIHCAGTTTVEPGWLVMHPGPAGEVSLLRYVAPAPGQYQINALFQGVSGYGGAPSTTTDASVIVSGDLVFEGGVHGGGAGNVTTWTGTVSLAAGDPIDFQLGDGRNGWGFDGTRVDATVTWVGERTSTCIRDGDCPSRLCLGGLCQIIECDGVDYALGPFVSPNEATAVSDPAGTRIGNAGPPNQQHPVLYVDSVATSSRYAITGQFLARERAEFGIVFGGDSAGGYLLGSMFATIAKVWIGEFRAWNPAPRVQGPGFAMNPGQTYVLSTLVYDADVRGKLYELGADEPDWQIRDTLPSAPVGTSFGAYVYHNPDVVLTSLELCAVSAEGGP